jgi:hypothetical protein
VSARGATSWRRAPPIRSPHYLPATETRACLPAKAVICGLVKRAHSTDSFAESTCRPHSLQGYAGFLSGRFLSLGLNPLWQGAALSGAPVRQKRSGRRVEAAGDQAADRCTRRASPMGEAKLAQCPGTGRRRSAPRCYPSRCPKYRTDAPCPNHGQECQGRTTHQPISQETFCHKCLHENRLCSIDTRFFKIFAFGTKSEFFGGLVGCSRHAGQGAGTACQVGHRAFVAAACFTPVPAGAGAASARRGSSCCDASAAKALALSLDIALSMGAKRQREQVVGVQRFLQRIIVVSGSVFTRC